MFTPYFDRVEEYYESGVALSETGLLSPDAEGLEPHAWRGPLYPAFVAAVEAGFAKPWPGHVAVAQAVLSTLAVAVVAALGLLLGGIPAALFAAAFAAFDPGQILAVSSLNIHGFYGLTVLALAAAAALAAREPSSAATAGAGLSLAGSLLCRSSHLFAAPLLAVLAARRSGLKAAAALLLWTALGLLPWTVRNAARIGGFTALDVGGGSYSLLAATQGAMGAESVESGMALAETLRPGFSSLHPNQTEAEGAMRALAYEEIARRPGRYALGCLRRLWFFWRPLWPLVLLAGFAFLRSRPDAGLAAAACVAASFSAYAALGGHPGYELGVAPVMSVLTGCGAAALLARFRKAAAPDAALAAGARRVLIAWIVLLLAFTACVQAWAVVDASRGRRPAAAYTGPRVLSLIKDGTVASGGRWRKSLSDAELRAKPLRNEGVRLFMEGRVEAAVAAFRAAVAASPRGAEDRLNLCVALGRLGKKKEALVQCDRAVALARGGDAALLESARSSRESLLKTR